MMDEPIERLIELVEDAERMVAFTGAGISTESGIPDFRGPGGTWEKFDPNEFHIDKFTSSEASRRRYWLRSTEMYQQILMSRPNAAHQALVSLARMGKLGAVVTQNIDGLHQAAGSDPESVIELHGTTLYVGCLSCGWRVERTVFQPLVGPEGDAPNCERCGGLMKPATISFGQMLTPQSQARALEETDACDLFLVIGSSLVVYPAAGYPMRALNNGAALVILNKLDTPFDGEASVVLNQSAGAVMSQLVKALGGELAPVAAPLPS